MKRQVVEMTFVALSAALLLLACLALIQRLRGLDQEEGTQLYVFKEDLPDFYSSVIVPGNYVDIVSAPRDRLSGGKPHPGAYMVLRKVKVVDVAYSYSLPASASVTLNLAQEQAAKVSLAQNRGALRFHVVSGPN